MKQVLVRFEDRTHVINDNDDILQQLSDRTGWPADRLRRIVSNHEHFVSVSVVSAIRGGKGGFGTLLKGQSRQAGAKATTNFGACRDLQGRRLRHVNDQMALQHYQEWQRKVQSGQATQAEMAKALINSSSGVAGWHLQLPNWAGVSKVEQRKLHRQFRSWRRQERMAEQAAQEQRQAQERHVQSYVDSAEHATERVTSNLHSALQQGLAKAKVAKKQKTEPDPPLGLVTLSGDVVLAPSETETNVWKIQSQSNFCTVGIILNEDQQSKQSASLLYYEVTVESGGLVQVGWATRQFQPNSETGDGVGDDDNSWAYDGSRQIKLHGLDDKGSLYGKAWKAGDTIGCLYNDGEISYFVNGASLGVAFSVDEKGIVLLPAISCNPGQVVSLRLDAQTVKHAPPNATAVGSLLAKEDVSWLLLEDEDDEEEATKDEDAKPAAAAASNESDDKKNKPHTTTSSETKDTENKPPTPPPKIDPTTPVDLDAMESVGQLQVLGLDRLKHALMIRGVKCGGTLHERAARLWSLKGLQPSEYPAKLLKKKRKQ